MRADDYAIKWGNNKPFFELTTLNPLECFMRAVLCGQLVEIALVQTRWNCLVGSTVSRVAAKATPPPPLRFNPLEPGKSKTNHHLFTFIAQARREPQRKKR